MPENTAAWEREKTFCGVPLREILKAVLKIIGAIFAAVFPYLLILAAMAGFCDAVFQILNPWDFNPTDFWSKMSLLSESGWETFACGDTSMLGGTSDYQTALCGLARGLREIDHGGKTNRGLVQFVKNAADTRCGYVWGWHGQEITAKSMEAWQHSGAAQSGEACSSDADVEITLAGWHNKPGFDCSGLIIGYMCFNPSVYADHTDPYPLTDSERGLIEQTVANEAEGEPYEGQMAIAQCILDTCLAARERPGRVVVKGQYAVDGSLPITASVKSAVSDVFDNGRRAVDAPIRYFYQPGLVQSGWHESLAYVTTIGHHKFFAAQDYDYGFTGNTHGYGYRTTASLYETCIEHGKKGNWGTLSANQKFMPPNVPVGAVVLRNGHAGIYIGNDPDKGAVIVEAAGFDEGVKYSTGLNSVRSGENQFTWWAKLPAVTYE